MLLRSVVFSAIAAVAWCDVRFPPGFKFGAATAAYQIEGAWNVSDKGESIWDRHTHTRGHLVEDGSTGDVACDSYHLWQRDVQIAKELGLQFYRFSLSWPRLLPSGFANRVSQDGARYYNELIDELLRNDIEPVITIYHWDLPQRLQELGGWINPLISDWFADYAKVAYTLFGDRVKTWITINEPMAVCEVAYSMDFIAPANVPDPGIDNYICAKNLLMAHAKAYRTYEKEFKSKYNGEISLSNHLLWILPHTPEDEEICDLVRDYITGIYSHAIYSKEGGWPPALEKFIAEKSRQEGYPRSRLPAFTKEEIDLIRGTYDFFALNHYTSRTARKTKEGEKVSNLIVSGVTELGAILDGNPEWEGAAAFWFKKYPEGLRQQLVWLKKNYGDLKFLITENGYPTDGGLDDDKRIEYFRDYLEQVLLAIEEDGVNVVGYTAWSLMDNFEWMDGYKTRFGLYEVDFTSPQRTRTARKSARYYAQVIKTRSFEATVESRVEL